MRIRPYLRCAGRFGLLPLICLSLRAAYAGSATWNLNPATGDWNTAANWTPATVPNSPTDVASFGLSNTTDVSVSAVTTVDSIIFNPGGSAFTTTVGPEANSSALLVVGSGITNNSGVTQNFATINSSDSGGIGTIEFFNGAIAGSGLVFTNIGGSEVPPGSTKFWNTSSAGDAVLVNLGGEMRGTIEFHDNSTAGNATFDNGPSGDTNGGLIAFYENATAGNGYFINEGKVIHNGGAIEFYDNSTAGTATFVNMRGIERASGGITRLFDNASADHGTFTVEGADPSHSFSFAEMYFFGDSTAGDATITVEGGLQSGKAGGKLHFEGQHGSGGGNSTLIAENGPGGESGGVITFDAAAGGGTARVVLLGPTSPGTLEINVIGGNDVTVGSIEGSGLVRFGLFFEKTLTIGSNNLSTTFSGPIQDDTGLGAITKIGTGTLILTGANTYSRGTTITSGILLVSNLSGSGTGTGVVHVNAGTLGGSGIIAGAVTVGTNNGTGAFLAPSKGAKKPATLTIQGALTLNDDSTLLYKLDTKRARADEVIANGMTIDSGAKFSLRPSGNNALTSGQVFTVVSNTSAGPIVGTFHNLADGAIVTVNGNNLQASYTGGDGNGLTLTVVP